MDESGHQEETERSTTTETASGDSVNLTSVIMVLAIIINVLVAVTGIIGAIDAAPGMSGLSVYPTIFFSNAAWALFFFSLGLIFFAIIGILCELHAVVKMKFYIQAVGMFARFWSRAIWYIVIGFLALGVAGAMGVASAICCWVLAALLLLLELLTHTNTI